MEISKQVEKGKIYIGNTSLEDAADTVHIGYGIDENFVMPMGVSCISILENNPRLFFAFHVLIEDMTPQSQEKLRLISNTYSNCLFIIHLMDLSIIQGVYTAKWGKAAYMRAFLGQVLEENIERILYLDGDVLCIHSLNQLIEKPFHDQTVMVVEDTPRTAIKQCKKFHLQHYFNSGVLYINLIQWRKNKIAEKFLDACFKYGTKLHYPDQDALNIILKDQKIMIERAYDFIPIDRSKESVPPDTVFIHYTGGKPWYAWLKYPLQKYFMKYYALSPWKNDPLWLPRGYPQMHSAARNYKRRKEYASALYWHLRYLQTKIKTKLHKD